jgi:drug/metabolite transporter (DMT)-like permease
VTQRSTAAPRSRASRVPLLAWAILLVAGGSWGATYSLAKIAAESGAHPLGIALWQGIVGAAILTITETARRRRLPLDRRHLWFYLLCGLLGTAIPSTLY